MAWLCVDEDGDEMIFDNKPKRDTSPTCGGYWSRNEENDYCNVDLPKGTIKKLIGKKLTWESEPYELKDNIKSEKKFNWRIMLLSIIWSLVLICLSNVAMDLSGTGKLIAIILVAIIMSLVFYFGYRDVDIKEI